MRLSVPAFLYSLPLVSRWLPHNHIGPRATVNLTPPLPSVFDKDATDRIVYRYRQQQSVNLGSWFVLEDWMTMSLFDSGQHSEHDVATTHSQSQLENHWDTWFPDGTFRTLAQSGINTVRLPIGYWDLGPDFCQGTDFQDVAGKYTGAWERIMDAIKKLGDEGVGVLVDLHGAPGSQNAQPHSGVSSTTAKLWTDDGNIQKTIDVLAYITKQVAGITNVVGIQLLNEPVNDPKLEPFYAQALDKLRDIEPYFPYYIHDGFNLEQYADFVNGRNDFVIVDYHSYFVFTTEDTKAPAYTHTSTVNGPLKDRLNKAKDTTRGNLIVGEWSCSLTDATLNADPNPDKVAVQREFCEAEMDVYTQTTGGWHFWSIKREGCDRGWCWQQAATRSLPGVFWSYQDVQPESLSAVVALLAGTVSSPNGGSTGPGGGSSGGGVGGGTNTGVDLVKRPGKCGVQRRSASSSSGLRKRSQSMTLFEAVVESWGTSPAVFPPRRPNGSVIVTNDEDPLTAPRLHPRGGFSRFLPTYRSTTSTQYNRPRADSSAPTKPYDKGYAFGQRTALVFASRGFSRVGFIPQYLSDALDRPKDIIGVIMPGALNSADVDADDLVAAYGVSKRGGDEETQWRSGFDAGRQAGEKTVGGMVDKR